MIVVDANSHKPVRTIEGFRLPWGIVTFYEIVRQPGLGVRFPFRAWTLVLIDGAIWSCDETVGINGYVDDDFALAGHARVGALQ